MLLSVWISYMLSVGQRRRGLAAHADNAHLRGHVPAGQQPLNPQPAAGAVAAAVAATAAAQLLQQRQQQQQAAAAAATAAAAAQLLQQQQLQQQQQQAAQEQVTFAHAWWRQEGERKG